MNNTLNYIKKINKAAKFCGKEKQNYYYKGDHKEVRKYKKEQNKIYLLKHLLLLKLEEDGVLIREERRKGNKSGTILETFVSSEGGNCYHSISENQEIENKEILQLYGEYHNNNLMVYYLPYIRYLEKQLNGKYKTIYDILTSFDFIFDSCNNKTTLIKRLSEMGVTGKIYKQECEQWSNGSYYFNYYNIYLSGIKLCTITVVVFCSDDDYCNCDYDDCYSCPHNNLLP